LISWLRNWFREELEYFSAHFRARDFVLITYLVLWLLIVAILTYIVLGVVSLAGP
jgi:hypothetical protein